MNKLEETHCARQGRAKRAALYALATDLCPTGGARSGAASPAASELMKRGIQGPNRDFEGNVKLVAGNKEV